MSTWVIGIKPADDEYNRMLGVWRTCNSAGVSIPQEVRDFFGESADTTTGPDPKGTDDNLIYFEGSQPHPSVSEFRADMQEGFEVDLRLLPAHYKILRFVNSY